MTTVAAANTHALKREATNAGMAPDIPVNDPELSAKDRFFRGPSVFVGSGAALATSGGVFWGTAQLKKAGKPEALRVAGFFTGLAAAYASYKLLQYGTYPTAAMVRYSTTPDLTGVPQDQVYSVLNAHHERNAAALEPKLAQLKRDGKISSYAPVIGAGGYVIETRPWRINGIDKELASSEAYGHTERGF